MSDSLPARVRAAAAAVAEHSTHVRLVPDALEPLATRLVPAVPALLAEERPRIDDASAVLATVLTWNAVNYGSGWFPVLTKRPGLSGARSLNAAWNDWCAAEGPPSPSRLQTLGLDEMAAIFEQDVDGPAVGLLAAFRTSLRELGALADERFDGSWDRLVASADGHAVALCELLSDLPSYRDEFIHDVGVVPIYKRAQITASHLHQALGGVGLGAFDDLDQLTCFADNLVPHVLRHHGVLEFDEALSSRVATGVLLTSGEKAEVEIRAVSIHAVELLATAVGTTAAAVDHQLWQAGQDPQIKRTPRHRCRCMYY